MDKAKLTPAEVTNLFNSYLTNTMTIWVTRHFIVTNQCPKLHSILEYAEEIAMTETEKSKAFLEEANHPLPQKFGEDDVDVNGPSLFTDNFILLLKIVLSSDGLSVYALSLSTSTRSDIRQFYEDCLKNTSQLYNRLSDLAVEKGLHHPEFHIPIPDTIEKVSHQSFLAGWFADRRPLTSNEVMQLVASIKSIEVGKEVMRGFGQVTKSKQFMKHFERGVEMCQKQINVLQSILTEYELPTLPTWENEVTDSTLPPFSDKLMLYKVVLITGATAGRYGAFLSSVLRKDLGVLNSRLLAEQLLYEEDGINLMIEHEFLDQLPMAKEQN